MKENETEQLDDHRSFESRVFARFDAIDLRLDELDSRFEGKLGAVEIRITKLEERQYDTKPIWEQALAAILEVKADVAELKGDVAGLKADVAVLKADVAVLKADVAELKTLLAETNTNVAKNTVELTINTAETTKNSEGLTEMRTEMRAGFAAIRHDMENELRGVGRKLDALNHNLLEVQADQRYVDSRLTVLEEQTKSP